MTPRLDFLGGWLEGAQTGPGGVRRGRIDGQGARLRARSPWGVVDRLLSPSRGVHVCVAAVVGVKEPQLELLGVGREVPVRPIDHFE